MWNTVLDTSSIRVDEGGVVREVRKAPVIRPHDLLLAIEQEARAAGAEQTVVEPQRRVG